MVKSALIGYTGFVGSNLFSQHPFTNLYNSSNIDQIDNESFDLIVCAGARAEKWKINQEPEKDFENINRLISHLRKAKTKKFVLISTVDVYPTPVNVDEDTIIPSDLSPSYGSNRLYLEKFCSSSFNCLVIRLPGLFGKGLKKNVIYDFLNKNNTHLIHSESVFQFYNLDYLWLDIETALKNDLRLVNFATKPITVKEIAKFAFDSDFNNTPVDKKPVNYNFRSKYFRLWRGSHGYLYSKSQVLNDLKDFVKNYQKFS